MKKTRKILAILLSILVVISGVPVFSFAIEDLILPGGEVSDETLIETPETPEGYTNRGIVAYDESGVPIYCFESSASEYGLVSQKWITALGEEVDNPFIEPAYPDFYDLDRAGSYPDKYDARDYGYITPVEQQIGGTCWAHATAAAVEASHIKSGYGTKDNTDISEYHIAWYSRKSYYPDVTHSSNDGVDGNLENVLDGGNPLFAVMAFNSYTGAAFESNFSIRDNYDTSESERIAKMQEEFTFDNRFISDVRFKGVYGLEMDINQIKQGILDYGAAYIAFYSNGGYYFPFSGSEEEGNYCFYCPEDYGKTDHAVTIVGWDDNFAKENFNSRKLYNGETSYHSPVADGAWLVKNSWGDDWGMDGYFWISYYDQTLTEPHVFAVEDPEDFDNVYLYDGHWGSRGTLNTSSFASVFTAEKDENLVMVTNPNTDYVLKVYKDLPETVTDPTAGTLVYTQSGSASEGKHIAVAGDVPLKAGEKFSIVMEGTKIYYEGKSSTSRTSNPNESFYKDEEGNWVDSNEQFGNICLRAFTNDTQEKESYRVAFSDGDSFREVVYSENGEVNLPVKANHTYVFTYNGEDFDGTGVTKDMYVETHCYPTNGLRKVDTPCTVDYECIYCGKVMKPSVTKHNYIKTVIPASETNIGYTDYTCSVCGDYYYDDYNLYEGAEGGQINDIWWQYSNGNLVLFGKGDTPDYTKAADTPWAAHKSEILKVDVSKGVTSIGNYLFAELSNAYEINIPDTIIRIGSSAFYNTSQLKEINITENMKTIEGYAFGYSGITQVVLPETLETLGTHAFHYCRGLTEGNIPGKIKTCGRFPFYGCSAMNKLTIGEGVKAVDDFVYYCGTMEVIIPSTATRGSFLNYTTAEKFIVHPDNQYFVAVDGVLYNKQQTKLVRYPSKKTDIIYFKAPATVTEIGDYCFYYVSGLKYLDLSECVTRHTGNYSLQGASSLLNVNLPKSAFQLFQGTFSSTNIKAAFVPSTFTFIEEGSFTGSNIPVIYTDSETAKVKAYADTKGLTCVTDHTVHNYDTVAYTFVEGSCSKGAETIKTCECGQFIYEIAEPAHIPVGEGVVTDPTCTTDGYTTYLCSLCNEEYISDIVPSLDHSFKWIIDKNATCVADGLKHEKCENCIVTRSENTVIPATGNHSYSAATVKAEALKSEATCENAAIYYYSCAVCGNVEKNDSHTFTNGNALDHSYEWVIDKAATCGEAGAKHEKCGDCTATRSENTVIPATGNHSFKWITDKEATCGEAGAKHEKCENCTATRSENTVIPATGNHSFKWIIDKEATCGEAGAKHEKCENCTATRSENTVIPATGNHSFKWITDKEATCGEAGAKHEKCENCTATRSENTVIPATGNHSFKWIIDKEATCGEAGAKHEKCENCTATRSENTVIPATGNHNYKWVIDKNATCVADGLKHEKCENCIATRSENTAIHATGNHSYTAATVKAEALKKAATCENAAIYYYSCAVCGNVEKNDSHTFTNGNALAHSFSSWKEVKAPSCTKEGELQRECGSCGLKETKVIEKTEHKYVDSKVVEATCTSGGYTERICTECENLITVNKVNAKGHNDGNGDGLCDACGTDIVKQCDHICHKGGFVGFIWKIVQLFWKLFKINPICECGVAHY